MQKPPTLPKFAIGIFPIPWVSICTYFKPDCGTQVRFTSSLLRARTDKEHNNDPAYLTDISDSPICPIEFQISPKIRPVSVYRYQHYHVNFQLTRVKGVRQDKAIHSCWSSGSPIPLLVTHPLCLHVGCYQFQSEFVSGGLPTSWWIRISISGAQMTRI